MNMILEAGDMQSIAVYDKKRIESFISKPAFPFLISFARTGSHWLRMIMELYIEKPSLVRIFYYKDAEDFTCYHRHDEDLNIERENVIYLYRHPVDTIYSNLCYFDENIHDIKKIEFRSKLYGHHLKKWLLEENFTSKKTIVSYEGMQGDIDRQFKKICRHFSVPFKQKKLRDAVCRVTKDKVQRKTPHDPKVINLSKDYQITKELFKIEHADFIMDCIYSIDPRLEKFIKDL